MFGKLLQFLIVAIIWGSTNPLLKKGSVGVETVDTSRNNKIKKALLQLKWLLLTPSFTLPFLLNQCGSVLYYIVVANSDISLAVPVINSLTLVVTALAGRVMGEAALSIQTYLGMVLVVTGVCISVS